MKKSTFSLIATVALVLSPVAAFAQQIEISNQNADNSGAAIGIRNVLDQEIYQENLQTQVGVDGYYPNPANPQLQISGQGASNSGAAIGDFNYLDQNVGQYNDQYQNYLDF